MVSTRAFLVPFKYSQKLAYVLEFSHQKLRIYKQSGIVGEEATEDDAPDNRYFMINSNRVIEDGNGWSLSEDNDNDLMIVTPYTYDDLWDNDELCFKLQTIQNGDVLYIFSESYPIKVLKRYSDTNWVLSNLELTGGPFMAMNSTEITLTAANVVGNIALTASDDVFSETDVGRLIRLRGYDDNIKVWSAGMAVDVNDVFYSDNKYYQAQNAGTSGTKKPVHTEGIRSDGEIRWLYLHDGTGIVKVITYTDAQHVVVKVMTRLPDAVTSGTVYWEFGLLHGGGNYPKSGAFFRNRFAFLVNTEEGPKVCLSFTGDYNNFNDLEYGEATAESAITVPVLNTEFNEGKWLFAGDVLFVGTGTAEFYIDVISASSALSNDNVKISQISNVGSKAIMPVAIGAHTFFADRYGLSLRDLSYNYYNDGYDEIDISLLGKHLFQARIVAMAYQEVPDKILWCLTGDGHLAALTFSAEQEVAALSRHDFDGEVESLAVVPNMEACQDEVWFEIKRSINNKTSRSIEFMENGMPLSMPESVSGIAQPTVREAAEKDYILRQARYLDGAVLFCRSQNDTTAYISGLDHLEGETVSIFADGEVHPKQLVVKGKVFIKATDTLVLVGKEITSQYMPQAVYLDDNNGSGIGQKQRIDHVILMLYLSGGGKIGESEDKLADLLYRSVDAAMNVPQELFTGNKEILFNGATNPRAEPAQLLIENTSPLPMNILALIPVVAV